MRTDLGVNGCSRVAVKTMIAIAIVLAKIRNQRVEDASSRDQGVLIEPSGREGWKYILTDRIAAAHIRVVKQDER